MASEHPLEWKMETEERDPKSGIVSRPGANAADFKDGRRDLSL